MYVNPNLFLSIPLSIICFMIGLRISKRIKHSRFRNVILLLSLIISIPGFSMILYYAHLIDTPNWYIGFRSINGIEVSNSLIGLFFGLLADRKSKKNVLIGFTLLFVLIPYIKPIVRPISIKSNTEWIDDVCIQSTGASCGPSSLATIFNHFGLESTEFDISKNGYTCSSGTEIWYILRYAKDKGLEYDLRTIQRTDEIKYPCILGTRLLSIGHFVTVLDKVDNKWIIGDPLVGRLELSDSEFDKKYKLDGLMIEFR